MARKAKPFVLPKGAKPALTGKRAGATGPEMPTKAQFRSAKARANRERIRAYNKGDGAKSRGVIAFDTKNRATSRAKAADQREIARLMEANVAAGGGTRGDKARITRMANRVAKGQRAYGSGGG